MPWEGSRALGDGVRRRAAPRGRRAGRGDRPARVEPGRRAALRLRPHRLVEPLPRRRRAGDRGRGRDRRRRCGCSASPGTRSSPTAGSSARSSATGADHLAIVDGSGIARRAARADADRRPDHRRRARAVRRRLPHALAAASSRVDLDTGAIEPLSDDGDEVVDAAYVSVPRPLEYPTAGERTAHALFYPPHNPDFDGAGGRAAAADRARPRRADRARHGHALARDPVLHQPRVRGRRRQLRRQHRLRPRVPRPPARAVGDRRHRGRRQRGARARRARARPTASGWRSPAAARAAGRCCARSPSAPTCSPPAPTTTASRT